MTTRTHDHHADTVLRLNARELSTQSTQALLRAIASVTAALCLRTAAEFQLACRRYTTRDELRELDTRALQDIGLTKDDVETEVNKWFWQG